MKGMAQEPCDAKIEPTPEDAEPKIGESLSEALVTLLTVVLFGLGWAHVEIGRIEAGDASANRYAAPAETNAAPLPVPVSAASSWTGAASSWTGESQR